MAIIPFMKFFITKFTLFNLFIQVIHHKDKDIRAALKEIRLDRDNEQGFKNEV